MKKFINLFIFSILMISLFSLSACSNSNNGEQKESTNIKNYKMNDIASIGNMEIRIENVEENSEMGEDIHSRGKFVIVSFYVKNIGDSEITVDENYFKLFADRKTFSPSVDPKIVYTLGDSYLMYKTINPGMDTLGVVVFEVPDDIQNYYLIVEPPDYNEIASIKLYI